MFDFWRFSDFEKFQNSENSKFFFSWKFLICQKKKKFTRKFSNVETHKFPSVFNRKFPRLILKFVRKKVLFSHKIVAFETLKFQNFFLKNLEIGLNISDFFSCMFSASWTQKFPIVFFLNFLRLISKSMTAVTRCRNKAFLWIMENHKKAALISKTHLMLQVWHSLDNY